MIKRTSFKKQYLQSPPVGYTKVEYLESVRRISYIAIRDLTLSTDIGVFTKFGQYELNTQTQNPWHVCSFSRQHGSGYPRPVCFTPCWKYAILSTETTPTIYVAGEYETRASSKDEYSKFYKKMDFIPGVYTSSCNFINDGKIIFDQEILGDCGYLDKYIESVKLIAIFTFGNGDNVYTPYNFKGTVYNVKISKGSNVVRNLQPSISKIGAPCMFDLVTRKPYYNSGAGDDFLYPTPSTTYSLRRPQAEYAKMTERGVQKLYHLPTDYKGTFEDYITQNNFKKIIETECPNEEGKYYGSRWVETDTELIVEWFEIDPPQEEFFEENS